MIIPQGVAKDMQIAKVSASVVARIPHKSLLSWIKTTFSEKPNEPRLNQGVNMGTNLRMSSRTKVATGLTFLTCSIFSVASCSGSEFSVVRSNVVTAENVDMGAIATSPYELQSQSATGKPTVSIKDGAQFELCQEFAEHLKTLSLPPLECKTYGYCRPPLPELPEFTEIEFQRLEPEANMDLVKEIDLSNRKIISKEIQDEIQTCGNEPRCLDAIWVKYPAFMKETMAELDAGRYVLRRGEFDFDWDGKKDIVYQYREMSSPGPSVCTPVDDQSETQSNLRFFVRENDNLRLHRATAFAEGEFRRVRTMSGAFAYRGRTYLLYGSIDRLSIYEPGTLKSQKKSFLRGICSFVRE